MRGNRQNGQQGARGQSVEEMLYSLQDQMAQLVSSIQALEARQAGKDEEKKDAWPEDGRRRANSTPHCIPPQVSNDGGDRPLSGARVGVVVGEGRRRSSLAGATADASQAASQAAAAPAAPAGVVGRPHSQGSSWSLQGTGGVEGAAMCDSRSNLLGQVDAGLHTVGLLPPLVAYEEAPATGSVLEPADGLPSGASSLRATPPPSLHTKVSRRARQAEAVTEQQGAEQGIGAAGVASDSDDDAGQGSTHCGQIPRVSTTYSGSMSQRDAEGREAGSGGRPEGVDRGSRMLGSGSNCQGGQGCEDGVVSNPAPPWDAAGAWAAAGEGKVTEKEHQSLQRVEGNISEDATVTTSSRSSPQEPSPTSAIKQEHSSLASPHALGDDSCHTLQHNPGRNTRPRASPQHSKPVRFSGQDHIKLLEGEEGEEGSTRKVQKSMGSDTDEVLQTLKEDLKERDSLRQEREKGVTARTRWQRALTVTKYLLWDVLRPDDHLRILWDTINVFAILYAIIITPYLVAFEVDTAGVDHALAIVDLIINIFFMLDVIVTFRTAYISDEGDIVFNRLKIAGRYMMFWFWIDSVASIPWDLALQSETNLLMLLRLSRTTRVLRVLKVLRALRMVKVFRIGQMFLWFEEALGRQRLSITFFVLTVVCCLHWSACLYYFLASVSDFEEDSWVVRLGIENETYLFRYISSVYWAVSTMTTVGYGDITAVRIEEKIIASLVMAAGSSMFAYMMGSVATLIANSNELTARMTRQMLAIDRFVRMRRIPRALASQVRAFYAYRMERETQMEENDILMGLTDSLRSQLTLYVYKDLLEKIPFFKGKGASFITAIVPHLHPVYASPGDVIVFQGEEGHEMYFLLEGKLEARLYSDADPFLAKSKESISFARAGSYSEADLEANLSRGRPKGEDAEEVPSPHPKPRTSALKRVSRTGDQFQLKRKDTSEDGDGMAKQNSGLRKAGVVRRPHVDPEMWNTAGGSGRQRPPQKDAAQAQGSGSGQPVAEAQTPPPLYVHHKQRQRQQAMLLPPGNAGSTAAVTVQGSWDEGRFETAGGGEPSLQGQQDCAQDPLPPSPPSFQHYSQPNQWQQQQQQQQQLAAEWPPWQEGGPPWSMLPAALQRRHWPFGPESWRPWAHVRQSARVVPEGSPVAEGLLSGTLGIQHLARQQLEGAEGPRSSGNNQAVEQCDAGQLPSHPSGGANTSSTNQIPRHGEGASNHGVSPGARKHQIGASGLHTGGNSRRRASFLMDESMSLSRRGHGPQVQAIPMGAGAAAVVSNNNASSTLLPSFPSLVIGSGSAFDHTTASRDKARAALMDGGSFKGGSLSSMTGPSGNSAGRLPLVRNASHGRRDDESLPPTTSSLPPAPGSSNKHHLQPFGGTRVSSDVAAITEEANGKLKGSAPLPQLNADALEPREQDASDPAAPGSKYIVLNSYHPGDNFGEMACLKRRPHPATVVAVDLCYMYCLQREDLEAVIQLWPELQKELDRMVLSGQHSLMARNRQID